MTTTTATLMEFVLPARWVSRIDVGDDGCWLWTGQLNGYGVTTIGSRHVMAHRAIYELLREAIPHGLVTDHLCRVRNCVNPDHLEPVTQRINLLRGETLTAKAAAATECPADQEAGRRAADPQGARERHRVHDAAYRAKKRAERGPVKSRAVSAKYDVECTKCGAQASDPCRALSSGRVTDAHDDRRNLWAIRHGLLAEPPPHRERGSR